MSMVVMDYTSYPLGSPMRFANGWANRNWICPVALRTLNGTYDPATNLEWVPLNAATGMNDEGIDVTAGNKTTPWAPIPPNGVGFHGYKRSQIRSAHEKLFFADAQALAVSKIGSGVFPGRSGRVSNYDQVVERTGQGTLPTGQPFDAFRTTSWRHMGGANVAFFDAHAEWLRKDRIYTRLDDGTIVTNDRLWNPLQH
jgi:prepilin-type processing-associated H-X9-DG protein